MEEGRELPVGWELAGIGELCDLKNGRAFKAQDWKEEGIPIVRIQNLNKRGAPYNHFQGEVEERFRLRGGELLFAWSGTPGTSFGAHIWKGADAVLNQHIFRVDFDHQLIDIDFFRYAINQKLDDLIDTAHGGVGLRHVTKGTFEKTKVCLPPQAEQRRIAAKLDTTLAAVEACRQRLDGVEALLKRFRQAVLAAATSGALTREWRGENAEKTDASSLVNYLQNNHRLSGGHKAGNAAPPTTGVHDLDEQDLPAGWVLVCLRDLVRPGRPITYGILKPGPELSDGIPYVRVADYPGDRLNTGGIRKTSCEIDEAYKRSRLQAGDLLLSIRGTVGRLISIPKELEGANITQDSARLSIQETVESSYIEIALRSEMVQSRMRRAVKGVAVRGINIGDVRALQIPLPSIEEQEEISRRVSELFSLADQLEARLTAARKIVERLTPALLAKAFRGELVPQDPSDEPASVLLERIRAARQVESVAGKPSRRGRKEAAATPAPSPVDAAPVPPDRLANLLRECGALSERALLAASELDPAGFRAQLALERELGAIQETLEDGQVLLEAVG